MLAELFLFSGYIENARSYTVESQGSYNQLNKSNSRFNLKEFNNSGQMAIMSKNNQQHLITFSLGLPGFSVNFNTLECGFCTVGEYSRMNLTLFFFSVNNCL